MSSEFRPRAFNYTRERELMAGERTPGPLSSGDRPADAEQGTLSRTAPSSTGPAGLSAHTIPPIGFNLHLLSTQIRCLSGLFDEMGRQTALYLEQACDNGHCQACLSGVRYIPEDHSDAFGHCWIGCQGAKTCGQDATRSHGEAYECFREAMSYLSLGIWGHNSFEEDRFNQAFGRGLARMNPTHDCASLCYQAILSRALRFHGHSTSGDSERVRIYNCSDITLDRQEYERGWVHMPHQHLRTARLPF
jgi:hypothetical protein